MADENMTTVHRRKFGSVEEESRYINLLQLPEYQEKGWALEGDPCPDPEPPDIEILELKHKDNLLILEAARLDFAKVEAMVQLSAAAVEAAEKSLEAEKDIKKEMNWNRWEKSAIAKVHEAFADSGGKPIPGRMLMALAENTHEERVIRGSFLRTQYLVGKDSNGDSLFAPDPYKYREELRAKEKAIEAEKEARIRARMNEQGATV